MLVRLQTSFVASRKPRSLVIALPTTSRSTRYTRVTLPTPVRLPVAASAPLLAIAVTGVIFSVRRITLDVT